MPCGEKGIDAGGRILHQRVDCWWHKHLRDEHREVGKATLLRYPDGHRVGGSCGLKADREKHHLAGWFCFGHANGVER